jgi:folate-binding protein YgfZ
MDNWKQFLTTEGAVFDGDTVQHFGDARQEHAQALEGHSLCDLSHMGLIGASGEETQDFLQNQFCNDVRTVTPEHSQLNGYCNPKGRTLAVFRLFQRGDSYFLRLPAEILDATLKRLRMFVLRAKVSLEDAGQSLLRMGYAGPEAEQHLAKALGTAPAAVDAVAHPAALTVIRIPGPLPRFEIYGDYDALSALWRQLKADARPVGAGAWNLLDIHAGIPEVVEATREAFVPQMINLHAVDGLSFKKGCYPGQEIVARTHYLGKLKRRMYRAHIATDTAPLPGDALLAEGSESGQGVGKIVRAEPAPEGGMEVLAVIEIASAEQRQVHLEKQPEAALALQLLPYTVDTEEK